MSSSLWVGLIGLGVAFAITTMVKKADAPIPISPIVQPTSWSDFRLKYADILNNMDNNIRNEEYYITQRRQKVVSQTVLRALEMCYYPVDSIKANFDIDRYSRERKNGRCETEMIYDLINIVIYGNPTAEELENFETLCAKAYLKYNGLPPKLGITLTDTC